MLGKKCSWTLLTASLVVLNAGVAAAATLHGKLSQIDAKAKTFAVGEGKSEQSFTLAPAAKVMDGSKTLALESLKTGESVEVTYDMEEGKRVATRVERERASKAAPGASRSGSSRKPAGSSH